MMLIRWLLVLSVLFVGQSFGETPTDPDHTRLAKSGALVQTIEIGEPWVRKTLPVQKTSALYFSVINRSTGTLQLERVTLTVAPRTMIHQTLVENGIAKMRHADTLVIESGKRLELKPGGLHVMLMGLDEALEAGSTIPFTLHFADGTKVEAVAKVR